MAYRIPSIYPDAETRTRAIFVSGVGHQSEFTALMADRPVALEFAAMKGGS